MNVEELLNYGQQYISKDHVKQLLAALLDKNPLELFHCLKDEVDEKTVEKFKRNVKEATKGKPIQYVIGQKNFYGYEFLVNENVLIPRYETEELVEHTIKKIKKMFPDKVKILDIGCGSGNIGITLKKELPMSEVTLLDISKKALEIAKKNAENLDADVNFLESDLLEKVQDSYDVIISNPPYIGKEEPVDPMVKKYEPSLALYAEEEGLFYYHNILKQGNNHLNLPYLIAFEIGANQKEQVISLIRQYHKDANIETKKDLQGRDRMIFVSRKKE